jgi:hypothetical protein
MTANTLLLLNPAKRRRKKTRAKSRTPAQKAATKKLVALMKAKRSGSRKRRSVKRARKSTASINLKGVTMKKRSARRRYRRNPIAGKSSGIPLSTSGALSIIKPAAAGAVGALALNGVMNNVPLPASLVTGTMAFVTRAAVALLLGVVGSKVSVTRPYARQIATGALTVTLADLGKSLAGDAGINLAYINPGWIASPSAAGRGAVPGVMGRAGMARVGRTAQYLPSPNRASMAMARRPGVAQYVR